MKLILPESHLIILNSLVRTVILVYSSKSLSIICLVVEVTSLGRGILRKPGLSVDNSKEVSFFCEFVLEF